MKTKQLGYVIGLLLAMALISQAQTPPNATPSIVQFASTSFNVDEADGAATIRVVRTQPDIGEPPPARSSHERA